MCCILAIPANSRFLSWFFDDYVCVQCKTAFEYIYAFVVRRAGCICVCVCARALKRGCRYAVGHGDKGGTEGRVWHWTLPEGASLRVLRSAATVIPMNHSLSATAQYWRRHRQAECLYKFSAVCVCVCAPVRVFSGAKLCKNVRRRFPVSIKTFLKKNSLVCALFAALAFILHAHKAQCEVLKLTQQLWS